MPNPSNHIFFNKTFAFSVAAAAWILLLAGCASDMSWTSVFDRNKSDSYLNYVTAMFKIREGDYEAAVADLKRCEEHDPDSPHLKHDIAALLLELGRKREALKKIDEMLALSPESPDALLLSAEANYDAGKRGEAKKAFEKVLKASPDNREVYHILGNLYVLDKEFHRARLVYERFIKRFPGLYAGYLLSGRVLLKQKRFREAEAMFLKALGREPDLAGAESGLADVYRAQKNVKKLEALYRRMLKKNPERIDAAMGLAELRIDSGRPGGAESILKRLLKKRENGTGIIKYIAGNYIDEKRLAIGAKMLSALLKNDSENSTFNYLAGFIHEKLKRLGAAKKYYARVKPGSKFHEPSVINTALIIKGQSGPKQAAAFLEPMVRRYGENSRFIYYIGVFYEELKDYEKASAIFRRGLEKAPDDAELRFRLAVVYDLTGKREMCISGMKSLIELKPDHASALNYLGYTYAETGKNLDEAEVLIRKALEIEPDNGYIQDSLGWVHYQKKDYNKAVQALERAVRLVSDDPVILEHMGDAYLKTGRRKKALEYYRLSRKISAKKNIALEKKIESLKGNR